MSVVRTCGPSRGATSTAVRATCDGAGSTNSGTPVRRTAASPTASRATTVRTGAIARRPPPSGDLLLDAVLLDDLLLNALLSRLWLTPGTW